MEKIGLNDLLNVQGTAVMNHDKLFAKKMAEILNKITFDIPKEDWEWIMKNYTKS